MSIIEALIGGGFKGLAEGIGSLAKDIRTAITGETPLDPNKRAELLMQVQMLEAAVQKAAMEYDTLQMQGQIDINKIEAASPDVFKSGWRPAVGWVCVLGLCYTYLLKPILPWLVEVVATMFKTDYFVPSLPEVPMGDLIVLLAGLLGIGVMRSYEKVKGSK